MCQSKNFNPFVKLVRDLRYNAETKQQRPLVTNRHATLTCGSVLPLAAVDVRTGISANRKKAKHKFNDSEIQSFNESATGRHTFQVLKMAVQVRTRLFLQHSMPLNSCWVALF